MAHWRGSTCGGAVVCVALLLAACGQQTGDLQVPSTPPGDSSSPATAPPPPSAGPDQTAEPPTTTGPPSVTGGTTVTGTGGSATAPGTGTGPPDAGTTSTGATTSAATTSGAATSTSPPVLEGFLLPGEVARQEPTGPVDLVVSGVRVGPQPGYDRVVFDLTGPGTVGWRVEYTDEPAQDGSGAPVDLAGDHVLAVHIQGTGLPGDDDTAYDPPQLLVPGTGLSVVTEVLRLTPFEGQLNAYIGVESGQPFRVTRLPDPERLVVDVAHG